ncbi:unnamed protein product [Trichogramma brassicae]|uniref:Reverse transcriptase domain-containing protein n=1 Tax=Trichogramma brassicae TaxID=86971 RepID=A0A6H5IFV8_9HYME|nr:unnamed protein product [Trichogramma brassicae]
MRTNCIRGQRTSQCKARQCAAVEVSSPKAEGSSNKKSKKRKSPKKKPTSPPRTPPKEVAALEKTQAPQSNRYGERRTQWKNSNLQPSGGAIRKELRCTNCKQQGHWTTNCPTIECFKCHKKGHMARACPESEDNVERKDIACQVCGQRGVTVPECGRCSYCFDRSGNEQVEARGYANQQTQPSGGYLPVMLQIDREAGRIDMECTEILPVEMVLGVDFGRRWRVDISMGRNQWRSGDGPWHNFAKLNEARSMRCDIVAECAGITVCGGEREIIESKIKRLIPDVPPKLGHTDKIVHRIELVEGAKPVCHRTRRMTPKMEKIAHECLQKMKEEGIIEPAKSEWNSAPVLVKKSDGSYRFCVDYRDLNKVTKKDGYPCKNMDTILDRLRRARYISKIDLKSAYHQVCLDDDSKAYTAFSVQGSGQYQFLRLPFGLKCAPMTFQRLMDSLFGAEVEPYVFAYLDDIILVTETFEEHVSWLERVIRILLDAKLVVNRDKCEFCCQSVQFLGYVLDSSGLRIDSERVPPNTRLSDSEKRKTSKTVAWHDTPFVWGADQEQAFATLKQSLSEAPVLVRPDFDKEFAIQTDASDYAIGAVLTQEREDDGAQHQRGATAFVCRRCQGSNRKDCTVSPAGDGRASGGVELREKRQRGGKSQPKRRWLS